jgi:hypothetical protein
MAATTVLNSLVAGAATPGLFIWQADRNLPAGEFCVLDDGADWRDRFIWGEAIDALRGGRQPPGLGAHKLAEATDWHAFRGFLGGGARRANGSAVDAGFPPASPVNLPHPGAYTAEGHVADLVSWRVQVMPGVYIFADISDGALKLYNNGGAKHPDSGIPLGLFLRVQFVGLTAA